MSKKLTQDELLILQTALLIAEELGGRVKFTKNNPGEDLKKRRALKIAARYNFIDLKPDAYVLTEEGRAVLRAGGITPYFEKKNESSKVQEEKIQLELQALRNTVKDYKYTKWCAIVALGISIIGIIIQIVNLFIE